MTELGVPSRGVVTPRDVPSMAAIPDWFAGYPRLRGVYGLAPADAIALCSIATLRTVARGETVFHQGDPSDALFIVRSGHVAFRLAGEGDGAIGVVAGPGMPFGQGALTAGAPRLGTASAIDDTELIAFGRTEFEYLRRERPGVERFLVEVMSTLVRYMTARADDLVETGAERRVLRRLLELAYAFGPDAPVLVPLPQEDLATLAGVTRSTVNRVLRSAAEQGWVSLGWRRLVVLDPASVSHALHALPADADPDSPDAADAGDGPDGPDGDGDVQGHAAGTNSRPGRRVPLRSRSGGAQPGGSRPTPS